MTERVRVWIDGEAVSVPFGTTVAAAILSTGELWCRRSVSGEPRAPLCGMGICFECSATVNGRPGRRTCQLVVQQGMVIQTSC